MNERMNDKFQPTFWFGTILIIVSVTRRPLRERTVCSSTPLRLLSSRISKFYSSYSSHYAWFNSYIWKFDQIALNGSVRQIEVQITVLETNNGDKSIREFREDRPNASSITVIFFALGSCLRRPDIIRKKSLRSTLPGPTAMLLFTFSFQHLRIDISRGFINSHTTRTENIQASHFTWFLVSIIPLQSDHSTYHYLTFQNLPNTFLNELLNRINNLSSVVLLLFCLV